jgi:hypothetical protein
MKSDQSTGDGPFRTRHWFDKPGQGTGRSETHPMTEDCLGDLFKTLELRGATRQHYPAPGDSI